MAVTISSNSSPEEIKRALQKIQKGLKETTDKKAKKHFDAYKYSGIIKLKKDPIAIQKAMRDEWQ